MARLRAAQRRALPDSTFAGPGRSFPIPDKAHARAALRLIGHAPPSARSKIRARARAKLGTMKKMVGTGGTNPRLGS